MYEHKRNNKVYRAPRTPPPRIQWGSEKGFVLDCIAVSNISSDFSKVNPKLGPVIPPYNAQKDICVAAYFKFKGVKGTLKKSNQANGGDSIEGAAVDAFHTRGHQHIYLEYRNRLGAGHSKEVVAGHSSFMSDIRPITGYNGPFGFRRNTPNLRLKPSVFENIMS